MLWVWIVLEHRRLLGSLRAVAEDVALLRRRGLLVPAAVDGSSGYRYYSADQLPTLEHLTGADDPVVSPYREALRL
jgi:hypothetical protein